MFVAIALWLLAQQASGVPVSGVVLDPSGAVIPNAQVDLACAGTVPAQTARTDETGIFRFPAISPGRCTIRVTFDGFEPTTVRVTVGTAPAEVSTNTASNLDTSTVDQKALENLPVLNQDVIATMSRFLDLGA